MPQVSTNTVHDVVVIGSGAGGGTVTNVLANMGISVLLLEAGPMLSISDLKEHMWPYNLPHRGAGSKGQFYFNQTTGFTYSATFGGVERDHRLVRLVVGGVESVGRVAVDHGPRRRDVARVGRLASRRLVPLAEPLRRQPLPGKNCKRDPGVRAEVPRPAGIADLVDPVLSERSELFRGAIAAGVERIGIATIERPRDTRLEVGVGTGEPAVGRAG